MVEIEKKKFVKIASLNSATTSKISFTLKSKTFIRTLLLKMF